MSLTTEHMYEIGLATVALGLFALAILYVFGSFRHERERAAEESTTLWTPGSIGH